MYYSGTLGVLPPVMFPPLKRFAGPLSREKKGGGREGHRRGNRNTMTLSPEETFSCSRFDHDCLFIDLTSHRGVCSRRGPPP